MKEILIKHLFPAGSSTRILSFNSDDNSEVDTIIFIFQMGKQRLGEVNLPQVTVLMKIRTGVQTSFFSIFLLL